MTTLFAFLLGAAAVLLIVVIVVCLVLRQLWKCDKAIANEFGADSDWPVINNVGSEG